MGKTFMDSWVEGLHSSAKTFNAHRSRQLRQKDGYTGVEEHSGSKGRGEGRRIDDSKSLFRLELYDRKFGILESLRCKDFLSTVCDHGFRTTRHACCDVRSRSKIAAGTDRSTQRSDRYDVSIDHAAEEFDHFR